MASRPVIVALALLAGLWQIGCPAPPAGDSWLAALDGGVFLPTGTWIDFRHRHAALAAAGRLPPTFLADVEEGWGGSESWGIWGIGRRTRLRLFLRSLQSYDLHLVCRTAPHPQGRRQTVEVTVNGREIGTLEAGASWHRHRLAVPEGLLRTGDNRIDLAYDFHLDGIPGRDDRPLALAVKMVGLLPRDRNQPPSPGSVRAIPESDSLLFTGPGTYVAPVTVPGDARALELTLRPNARGARLRVSVLTLDGSDGGELTASSGRHRMDLASHRGRQVFLVFDADLPPGARFAVRFPRLLRDVGAAPPVPRAQPRAQPPAPGARPDIVIVILDAARTDHFGAYGYRRDTTPQIDRLATESLAFRNVLAECPYTLCSMPNLLTGLSFPQHRLVVWGQRLAEEVRTLAETLCELGYRTVALTGNPHSSRVTGSDQGFDEFLEIWRLTSGRDQIHPHFLTARAAERIAGGSDDRPLFLLAHYLPPHEPYDPDPRFDLFGDPAYDGAVTGEKPFVQTALARQVVRDDADLAELEALYDGNLRMADDAVGGLIAALRRAGRWDDTLFVVTSDHGEAFDEHGFLGHAKSLHEEMLRVPLVLRLPSGERPAGVDLERLASLGDLVPTILGRLGEPVPAALPGVDLLAPPERDRWLVQRSEHQDYTIYGLRTARWKLMIRSSPVVELMPPESRLYDLAVDPGETVDRAAERRLLQAGLALLLERALREPAELPAERQEGMSEEDEEMLRSLGYL